MRIYEPKKTKSDAYKRMSVGLLEVNKSGEIKPKGAT